MSNKKGVFKLILVAVLCFTLAATSVIAYAEETLESLDNKIENAEQQIQENNEKSEELSNEMDDLSTRIEQTEAEVDKLTEEVADAQKEVEEANQKLTEGKKELEQGNKALQYRLRNIYKSGNLGFVDVILSSENVSDLFSNFEMMKYIFKNDKEIVAELKKNYKALEIERENLQEKKSDLEEKQSILKEKEDALGADYQKLEEQQENVEAENEDLQKQIQQWEADSAAIAATINNAQSEGGYQPEDNQVSSTGYAWPVPGYYSISSPFGWRYLNGYRDYHLGIDIPAPTGTPVVASRDGKVIATGGQHWSYGNIVIIDHGNGVATAYAHNSSILVSTGQIVKQGQTIALAGNTGNSYGSHLHFEVRINGTVVNPAAYV